MAHVLDLPLEVLNTIITFLAMSSDGARDLARVAATCQVFNTLSRQFNILRVVNFQNVVLTGRCEPHHHINGLLSRCVRAGNWSTECKLTEAVLKGGTPLWRMMLENDLTNSSIRCATTLLLSERRYLAESLNTGSIADLPYILFSLEDLPHMHEPYARLQHTRLVRSFILMANTRDIIAMRNVLKEFMEFFVGSHMYFESGIHRTIRRMCRYECIANSPARSNRLQAMREAYLSLRLHDRSLSYRNQVISALDNLFQQGP